MRPSRSNHPDTYWFGAFTLDVRERALWNQGAVVPLTPKVFETLLILVERQGQLVHKNELMEALWPECFVAEGNLSQNIFILRKALGEGGSGARYIQTVPKSGYRFIAEVHKAPEAAGADAGRGPCGPSPVGDEPEGRTAGDSEARAALPRPGAPPASGEAAAPRRAGRLFTSALLTRHYVLALVFLAGVACAVVLYAVRRPPATTAPTPPTVVRSIAVLPFKNISQQSSGLDLGLGVTDIVITKLGSVGHFTVLPTSSVFRYVDKDYDALAVGRALKVDAVLDGTVQRDGGYVRVSLRLVRAADAQTLWVGVFDEAFEDIFKVQDIVAERVTQVLGRRLSDEERRTKKTRTVSVEAYEDYVRGLYFWSKRSLKDLQKGAAYFQAAIAKDPGYALAYAGLADALALVGLETADPARRRELFETARENALKSKALDAHLPEPYAAHFLVKYYFDKDGAGAGEELKRALELDESHVTANLRYGFLLRDRGDLPGARGRLQRALAIDPLAWIGNVGMCEVLIYEGAYEPALGYCQRAVETEPALLAGHFLTAQVHLATHRYQEAIDILSEVAKKAPAPSYRGHLGFAYAKLGQQAKAYNTLSKLKAMPESPAKHSQLAFIYAGLGDTETALNHLAAADTSNGEFENVLRYSPQLSDLRADPRFAELLRAAARR